MNLVTDDTASSVYGTAGVLRIIQNVLYRCILPVIRINGTLISGLTVDLIKVFRRRDILFFPQAVGNLRGTEPFHSQFEDIPHNLCRRFVNIPLRVFLRLLVPVRNSRRNTLAMITFVLPDRTDFLGSLLCVPLIKYILNWHHFHAGALFNIDIILNCDKVYTERRIFYLRIIAAENVVTSESGKVFYDNCTDKPVFDHFLHFLKARSVKCRTADTVVGKESVVADSVPFTVIFKDLLLMGDTIGFKLFFIFSLVFFIKIIDRKTAIKSRN